MTGWRRILGLQQRVLHNFLSGALIHKPENIFYFTSVYPHEPSFLVVPAEGEPELVVPRSSLAEAKLDSLIPVVAGDLDIAASAYERMLAKKVLKSPPDTAFKSMLRKIGESPIGIELDYLNVLLFQYFQIRNHQDISAEISALRAVKDSFEIEKIARACQIADEAMAHARERITPGMSEKELSGIFDARAKALGAEESNCRVKSGPNTALAFSRWMDGELGKGPLLIEYGARVKGYWSDVTRMFYLGTEPDSFFMETYHLVLEARGKALENMHPGQNIYGPETKIREVFRENEKEQNMVYTAGHGIGLEIHEEPVLGFWPSSKGQQKNQPMVQDSESMHGTVAAMLQGPGGEDESLRFEKGQIFVLESGLYFSSLGVKISDVVHISDKPKLLSTMSALPEDLVIPV